MARDLGIGNRFITSLGMSGNNLYIGTDGAGVFRANVSDL